MLNQCILIGRIKESHCNIEGVVEKIIVEVDTGKNADFITIITPREMTTNGLLIKDSMIAVKARISSYNAKDYRFVAERITVLGGSSNGS